MKKTTLGAWTLIATMALGACGEDPTVVNSGNLTEAEARAIAEFLLSSTYDNAFSSVQGAPDGPQAVPFNFTTQVDVTAPCPLGGVVDISATATISGDTEQEGGSIEMNMTEVHQDCMAEQEGTGIQFTLNGHDDVVASFSATSTPSGDMTVSGSLVGGLDWMTANGEGTCVINMSYSASGNELTGPVSATVTGSICGVEVAQELLVG